MDTTKATINNILYTIEHYPYQKDDLEWGTEEVMILISRIKELEAELSKIKSDSSVKAIIDWKEWIDKRPRSPVYEE